MNLDFLRPLYDTPEGDGRYVSVYLPASRASQSAASEIPLRWRAARERLAAEGADQATLDAIQEALTDPAQRAPGRALFGRRGSVRLNDCLPEPPRQEISRYSPLPRAMPLLAQRAPRLAHVRVAVDAGQGDGGDRRRAALHARRRAAAARASSGAAACPRSWRVARAWR